MPRASIQIRWRHWLADALVIIGIVAAIQLWQVRGLPEGPAPQLAGTLADGRPASLEQAIRDAGGRPVLVAFWATWCPSCRAEEGNLAAIAADSPTLTVAMESGTAAEIAQHLAERGRRLPAIVDADGRLAAGWNVAGVPTHFIVDGAGNIRFRVVGYASEWGLRARLWWAGRTAS